MKTNQISCIFFILLSITFQIKIKSNFNKQNTTEYSYDDSIDYSDIVPNDFVEFDYNGITFSTYKGDDSTNIWKFSMNLNFKVNETIIKMPFEGEFSYNSNLNLTEEIPFFSLITSPINSEGSFYYENLIEIKEDEDNYTITLITIYYKNANGEVELINGKLYTQKYNLELKNNNGEYDYKITFIGKKINPNEYKNNINGVNYSGLGKGEINVKFFGDLLISNSQKSLLSGYFLWDIRKSLENCIFVKLLTPFEAEKIFEYDQLVSIDNSNDKVLFVNIDYLDEGIKKTLKVIFYKNKNTFSLVKEEGKYKFSIQSKNNIIIGSSDDNC